jgi:hypothetical protein
MIVITLAGLAKRFFDEGYTIVKYKLPYNNTNVIESIFSYLPKDEKLLLILNKQFNDYSYFNFFLKKEGFLNFHIVQIDSTRGQYETVELGLNLCQNFWTPNERMTIYNGDTIRKRKEWFYNDCDGYIEVFLSDGNHWSFVDKIGIVKKVVEKNRISDYCSSGLYYFRTIDFFLRYKELYFLEKIGLSEFFIAPYYNILIENSFKICSGLVNKTDFVFCGTPQEYLKSIQGLNIQK